MATFEVEAGGKTFEVEAPSMMRAQSAARLFLARQRMSEQAITGAMRRNEPFDWSSIARPGLRAMEIGGQVGVPLAAAAVAGPAALATGAVKGIAGAGLGFGAGRVAEGLGAPRGTAQALGVAGGLIGPGIGAGTLAKTAEMMGGRGFLTRMLESLVPAAEHKVATIAAKELSGPEAAKAIELKLAQLAEKRVARETATKLAERRVSIAEERNQLLRMRLEGKAPPAPRVAPAQAPAPSPMAADPGATMPPTPVAVVSPPRPAPVAVTATAPPSSAELETIVLKIQQTATSSAERKVIREWLNQQPKEVASQIRLMLARRQAHPATVYMKPDPSAELARMLGQ